MGNEVSGKVLGLYRDVAARTGHDVQLLFEGLPIQASDRPDWFDWDTFALLNERLEAICGGPQGLEQVGTTIIDVEEMGRFAAILRIGVDPARMFWASCKWAGPSMFQNVETAFAALRDGHLQLSLTIPPSYRDSPQFFRLNAGMFRVLPRLIGLADAQVDYEIQPRQAIYRVAPPPSMTLWSRLRRALRLMFLDGDSMEEPTQLAFSQLVAQQGSLRLQYEQVQEARAVAEEALRVKSEFLATMSHELRTPLNGIMGMAELLKRSRLAPDQQGYVAAIQSSSDNLLAIISDILDFSKMEAGKLELERVEFPLRRAVEDVVELLATTAGAKQVDLSWNIAADVPKRVAGDERRLRQILTNLVGNAVKFTATGEIALRVAVEKPLAESGRCLVRFEVQDTGIGISTTDLKRLFEPFTQADGSNTRKYGGTGLGLAICKQLVNLLGGTIAVESVVGQGSRFWFTLPVDSRDPRFEAMSVTQAESPPAKVWLVDALETPRMGLRSDLSTLGLDVKIVEEGNLLAELAGAIEANEAPELIVLSWRNASEPALDRVHEIQALSRPESVLPVLVLQGSAPASEVTPDFAAAVRILRRPARLELLAVAVSGLRMMGQTGQAPPVRARAASGATTPVGARRVLVVEDHRLNQMVAVGMLKQLGYSSEVAENGVEALARLAEGHFDAVLMDCQMPEMDGFEATRHYRRSQAAGAPQLPIIAMTAYAMSGDRERCLAAGMDDYLSKPVQIEQLRTMLSKWITEETKPARPSEDGFLQRTRQLREMVDGATFADMVSAFCAEAATDLARLRLCVRDRDAEGVADAAHRLKGSCLNLGAARAGELCAEIVQLARAGQVESSLSRIDMLDCELTRVREVLMPLAG